ncbi:hypothetical protein GLOIN_2v1771851 [Rhizophagus irregularis DAOM 181602=DAOM 197198]|uniref:NUDE domain-containing protein n=1 Tax=Rhizophagus irregularis (strain DAOM 181602 / DAOM 197198 / MUCL 43194) TaxID=747089 RepID=A0A2P4Q8T6_RHIID|nr:hypothetical protein GLOIN_2v1771851 [Rhizophagus irregularis DAOM 181602=DAOM 197198]PKY23064.1 hypothetical protein RhiirB3_526237 [Rhizophagus irregularis]POG74049.1 hypothetical protein GLOIN_2v1771851 [Rhizophagus irregularis DAOM 181602=DAOM 197198]|eukprot:XP_025180915.1 hypothetical protein GLOIN_2v1771851 [Rhizophagus irregularis DAOM 181602=DAOM 197198]
MKPGPWNGIMCIRQAKNWCGLQTLLELLEQRIADLEAENAKIKEEYDDLESERIIEENARRDAENAEHKVRIEELEKNSADISAENSELKVELVKLRHDFDSSNLTQQPQHVNNSRSVGKEKTAVPQPDASHYISDPVIDQPINGTSRSSQWRKGDGHFLR